MGSWISGIRKGIIVNEFWFITQAAPLSIKELANLAKTLNLRLFLLFLMTSMWFKELKMISVLKMCRVIDKFQFTEQATITRAKTYLTCDELKG